jgi:radical SAM protein with 4Fe4S-binding SPASM domain
METIKFYSDVFFVKGFSRTLIYDSLKNKISFMPNYLYDKVLKNKLSTLTEEEITFLNDKEIVNIFNDNLKNKFPKIKEKIAIPYKFIFFILEVSNITINSLEKFISSYNNFAQLILILDEDCTKDYFYKLKDFILEIEVDTVEFVLKPNFILNNEFNKIFESLNNQIIVTNLTKYEINSNKKNRFVKTNNDNKISSDLITFIKSKKNNPYFLKKIYITKNGDIKNSIETTHIFDNILNINQLDFDKVLKDKKFKSSWKTRKENILVCKDCEFRRNCLDNRLPEKIREDGYIKLKGECDYNPYISKWSSEEGYLNLEKSGIKFDDSFNLIINFEKINKINNEIW